MGVPTIKDVAREAGVSVSTVSRVLNKSGYVDVKTEEKVRGAIEKLQYKPSDIARGLVSSRSKTLGLILPDISNPFFPELARAVEDTASEEGYAVIFCNSDNDPVKEDRCFQLLLEKRVDGIVLASQVRGIEKVNVPMVVMDARMDVHSVYTDNRYGGVLATRHLLEQGYERIGHIRGPVGRLSAEERYEGYLEVMGEREVLVELGDFQTESGYEAMVKLLARGVDSVFVANDLMALGAMEAISERGLSIGVIGFDGIPISRVVGLSTVEQPIYEMGVAAAKALMKSIRGEGDKETVVLKPKLVVRKSSVRKMNDE